MEAPPIGKIPFLTWPLHAATPLPGFQSPFELQKNSDKDWPRWSFFRLLLSQKGSLSRLEHDPLLSSLSHV